MIHHAMTISSKGHIYLFSYYWGSCVGKVAICYVYVKCTITLHVKLHWEVRRVHAEWLKINNVRLLWRR